MKPDVSLAVVTDEYQEVCPHCGRPMQQVPYYSAVMSKGGTHREIASLTQDKIVTTYNLSFITTIFGGYCPTCTLNAISKQNEIIREQNEHKSKEWNSLSEKERTARYCPWMTIVFLASSAFSILMLILTFLKSIDIRVGIALMILSAILSVVFGLGSWASNDGLFPLRHAASGFAKRELLEPVSDFSLEDLAQKIVKRRRSAKEAFGGMSYFTPKDLERMQH